MYPIVCSSAVITKSYLLSLIKHLFSFIVCKLCFDIRFRMMDAKFGGESYCFLNC